MLPSARTTHFSLTYLPRAVIAAIALVPLLILPGLLFYYDVTPKVAVLLLGAAAAMPLADRRGWKHMRALSLLLAAQAVSLALSTLTSTRPELSLLGSSWRRMGLLTQLVLLLFVSIAAAHGFAATRICRAMAVAAIPIAVYGILQYFGWDPLLDARTYRVGEGIWQIVRPPGTLGHAGYFANYLVMIMFAGLFVADSERGVWKAAGIAAAALAGVAIVLSGTRSALVGVAAGGVWLVWRRADLRKPALRLAGILAAILLVFAFTPPGQKLRSRAHWISEDPWGGARLRLWRDALRMGAARPLTGYGPEVFATEFPSFQSLELSRAYPDFYHESPHNMFLDAFDAQGIPGLAVLLGLCVLGFRAAWKQGTGLGAALAGAVAAQQFTVFVLPTMLYFLLIVAVLVERPPAEAPARAPRWIAAPAAVVLILAAAVLMWADHSLETARRDLQAGRASPALAAYQRAAALGLSADLWYSRAAAALASQAPDAPTRLLASQQAFWAGARATRTADDPHNAWYSLAALYAAANDFAGAERSLRAAVHCAPNWFKPHWVLAQMLRAAGRTADARTEAARAVLLDGGKNPEVAATLAAIQK